MARTRASVGAKISSGKSNKARCSAAPPPSTPSTSGTSEKSSRSHSGGNPVCPRETPKWQKPITNFFVCTPSNGDATSDGESDENIAGPSKPKTKCNTIQSDDENEELEITDTPKNQALDESIILEPLNGESSHKIDEYYGTKEKSKDVSNKENIDDNEQTEVEYGKRNRADTEDNEHTNKKVRIS